MALSRSELAQTWRPNHNGDTVLQDAYEQAVQYFEQELTCDNSKKQWVRQQHSIDEIRDIADRARCAYSSSGGTLHRKDAQKWTLAFSQRIVFYGQVLDTLSQSYPGYVSLVWGAMKFVLQGILNHAEIVSEFTKAMSEIADALPRIKVRLFLCPSDYMMDVVSRVYAHIMLFMQQAVKWYCLGSFRRALSSFVKPWSLSYKDTINQIRFLTASVDAIGNAAAGVELRDVSLELKEHDAKLDALRLQIDRAVAIMNDIFSVTNSTKTIACSISLTLDDHTNRIRDLQYTHILSILRPKRLPSDVLYSCRSIAKRRKLWSQPGRDSQTFIQTLDKWASQTGSTLFVVRAGPRAEAMTKDLALEVLTLLQASSFKPIWFFSERIWDNEEMGVYHILKTLIYQILAQNPDILQKNLDLISASKFQAASESELKDLLVFLITRLQKCFLIIETETLARRTEDIKSWCQTLEAMFQAIVEKIEAGSATVKILLVTYGSYSSADDSDGTQSRRVTAAVRANNLPLTKLKKLMPRDGLSRLARQMRRSKW